MDPGLFDIDRSQAGEDRPLGKVAVAYDLVSAGFIDEVGMLIDPGGDLRLNRLREERASALAEDLGDGIDGGWPALGLGGRLVHGGGLLGLVGHVVNV
jgi:hypothetical protein